MQLSHVTAFWLRLAGNILLDLFLYVHMFAPQVRARDCTTFNPFEPLPFSATPDTSGFGSFCPLRGRAALTAEVTRPRGRPASRCCAGAFQNSQRLEMC